jgi:hypothetical protein
VRFVAQLAYAEAVANHHDNAHRLPAAILLRAQAEYVSPVSIALIHSALDNRERAVEWIEIAYQKRALDIHRLFSEPEFQRLHGDPRVREILARVGLAR